MDVGWGVIMAMGVVRGGGCSYKEVGVVRWEGGMWA